MKKNIRLISCLVMLSFIFSIFGTQCAAIYAAEDFGTLDEAYETATSQTDEAKGEANGGNLTKHKTYKWYDPRSWANGKIRNANSEIDNTKNVMNEMNNSDGVAGKDTMTAKASENLSGLTKFAAAAQKAIIKIGETLEKIGDILMKVGKALKIVGGILKLIPWTSGIGAALENIGKIVYKIGSVVKAVGTFIKEIGNAALTGDINFANIIKSGVSIVKNAWTQGGEEYDNIDVSSYTDKAQSVIDKVGSFFGGGDKQQTGFDPE